MKKYIFPFLFTCACVCIFENNDSENMLCSKNFTKKQIITIKKTDSGFVSVKDQLENLNGDRSIAAFR
jgi:hypothetical protein